MLPLNTKQRVPLVKMMTDTVRDRDRDRDLVPPAASVPPVDKQGAGSVNAKEVICPKTGFFESGFGDSENAQERNPQDPDEPRDIKSSR